MDDDYEHRRGISFAQAEGVEGLPQQLSLREMSRECTAALWAMIHGSFEESASYDTSGYGSPPQLKKPWRTIMEVWHVTKEFGMVDEFNPDYRIRLAHIKSIITSYDYIVVFSFIQFVLQRPDCPRGLVNDISTVLQHTRSAYRVFDRMIVPISSDEQAAAITAALKTARAAEAQGPHAHLHNAANELSSGHWTESVWESITAVEGAARSIEPEAATLGPALSRLRTSIGLHPALSSAFGSLYGWTNQEKGVRHAMVLEGVPVITERDAIFMFGACASFVGYLLSAARETKLIGEV